MAPDPHASIHARSQEMKALLVELCNINSHTFHVEGVGKVLDRVEARLAKHADRVQRIPIADAVMQDDHGETVHRALAPCLVATRRAQAERRILLNIHADTVYGIDSPFQLVREVDANTLCGPGVIDAKGGLVVMLTALEAFETAAETDPSLAEVGWEVIINTDEEIGSPGSAVLLEAAAKRNHYGLLYEPALPGGALVSSRKGSGNYTIIVRGRSAHAGRAIEQGRNAVVAAAEIAVQLHAANATLDGATLNVGKLAGGSAPNVVPDLATLIVNARAAVPGDVPRIEETIFRAVRSIGAREGYGVEVQGRFASMPKVLDEKTRGLLAIILDAGRSIGLDLQHGPSGGASDGNRLAAAGLTTIDSLGPLGGEMHSDREFIHLDSLVERARLSLAVLVRLAEK